MGNFDLKPKKINAFGLADKVGRQSKAYAVNRPTVVKAVDEIQQGVEKLAAKAVKKAKK